MHTERLRSITRINAFVTVKEPHLLLHQQTTKCGTSVSYLAVLDGFLKGVISLPLNFQWSSLYSFFPSVFFLFARQGNNCLPLFSAISSGKSSWNQVLSLLRAFREFALHVSIFQRKTINVFLI